ncbi:glycoside hydrolase family 25 protein [Chelativorans salis]|uniref:Glycoside hydrolase family 25 protein n=1 Tax=Chelativorans salis TaxID=2978478 RepID=A0ABT2LGZ1_9HYPH|nr:glycoside hydrolase family 25 protein [Chelativorans sp. EGI FJ00035]MCT7373688.1 glycoside hydrolase family 25 protein [Chelativorans sp. EGI FJ00035]
MRFPGLPAVFSACIAVIGCTSNGPSVDDLLARPSQETTSSVTRQDNVVPPAAIGSASSDGREPQQMLAMAPSDPAPEVMTAAFAMPTPSVKPSMRGQIYKQRFRDAKPINFGSTSPDSLAVHGVDVSRWQGEIDWATLRAHGANFAYIKATDGGDHLDPMFKKNWRAAAEAGLRRGAYHFFYWCRTASEQADWFIRNVPKVQGALPPVLDVEWNGTSRCKKRPSRSQVLEKMQVFMDKLERHYGQRPIIYTAPDFYRDNLRGEFSDYPFWLRSVAAHPSKVYPDRKWLFWQYSGSGLSNGVDGKIDLNAFHGGEDEWHRWIAAHAG